MRRLTPRIALLLSCLLAFSPLAALAENRGEPEGWSFHAFGSNTSESNNPDPMFEEDGSVTLFASGGKIASSEEGISYYFTPLPADAHFEWKAKATVKSFNSSSGISTSNQKSFGLMLRDEVGEHRDSSDGQTANYVAVGALDTVMKGFYKHSSNLSKLDEFTNNNLPAANEVYDLSIKKSGNTYVMTSNGESETVTLDGLFTDSIYAGLYVARDAEVTFSEIEIDVATKEVSDLIIDAGPMKTEYWVGENLDLTGITVTAVYSDGSEEVLSSEDYVVTGFDSSEAGTNTISIHYNGVAKTVDLTIHDLMLSGIDIRYLPAKTTYYLGDPFQPDGMTVIGEYNDGYKTNELLRDDYTLSIGGQSIEDGYTFEEPGTQTITVTSIQQSDISATFNVVVKDASITGLDIRQPPKKTTYFIGDALDLDGLVVYVQYSDDSEIRLMRDEYEVSELNVETPGEKAVVISHKGKTASFPVTVKEKEITGIEIIEYPKTTYQVGESFDFTGLEVAKVYDNGDQEPLSADRYTVDFSEYDGSTAGVYKIRIIPEEDGLEPASFQVTVREPTEYEWKSIRFGQSTSSTKNYVKGKEDGTVEIAALDGAGKITGDHDGITFYYTEVDAEKDNFELSADIRVIQYAKDPHDGQESFGIMARDALGEPDDSSVFASNIAAVGGYSGGTREENGTQLFVRTGVLSSDGEGSQGIQKIMLKNEKPEPGNTYPEQDYRLTLSKTNSGYTGKLNDGKEEILFEPDILNVQDSKIYVGFYTARVAHMEVSNIDFNVTAAATDSPKIAPPSEPMKPELEVLSLTRNIQDRL